MADDPRQFDAAYFASVYRNYGRQNPARKLFFYRQLVSTHAAVRTGRRILEIGCAYGRFLRVLGPRWQKFGFDISEHGAREARLAAPDARVAVGSCTAIPMRGPFDVIVAFDVIEHVADVEAIGDQVLDILAPGGTFIFVVPVYDGPLGPVVRLLDHDRTHVHRRSRRFWLDWAERRFVVREWLGLVRYLLPAGPYLHWPTRSFRAVAPAVCVVAEKRHTAAPA
jgi:SAM-dependent methyltransferase